MTDDILITHRIFPETIEILRKAGNVRIPAAEAFSASELGGALSTARAVMVFMPDRIDAAVLAAAPRLSVVAAALKGYDNIDVAACTKRNIWLSIVPDLLTAPTAELTVGLTIALARHMRESDLHVRSGNYSGWTPRFYGMSLEYSTIGLVGMGAVGSAVAKRLSGFDCRMLYCDAQEIASHAAGLNIERRPLDALLSESDIVILCLPLLDSTIHLLDRRRIALMKPQALLVNPARGSLVDETAVADALVHGHLGGYAADAFELEDQSREDRPRSVPPTLLAHPHTFFSAHIGSATIAARMAIEARASENIVDALSGRRPRDAINQIKGGGA